MATKKGKLPKKASALIRVALADLKKVENNPQYIIDMGSWHEPSGEKCEVCFAGAVIAGALGQNQRKSARPDYFEQNTKNALYALDYFRVGNIKYAFECLKRTVPDGIHENMLIPRYPSSKSTRKSHQKGRTAFYKAMDRMANMLEAAGD